MDIDLLLTLRNTIYTNIADCKTAVTFNNNICILWIRSRMGHGHIFSHWSPSDIRSGMYILPIVFCVYSIGTLWNSLAFIYSHINIFDMSEGETLLGIEWK